MLSKAAFCAFANVALAQDPLKPTPKPAVNYMMKWQHFKQEYGKTYSSPVEEEQRFQVFKVNVDFIYMVNSRQNGYELGVTEFADMTADEFGSTHFGLKQPEEPWGSLPHLGTHEYAGETLADSVDWTTKGAVTPVKNQGQCGSCWSFSTTGSLEGAWKLAGNPLTSLSEQQFVDCDKVDSGCSGGLMDNAFKFAEKNAICTEESYPYKGKGGSCQASTCTKGLPEGKVTGFKDVTSDSEQAMMSAIQQQPVSIAIEADKSVFQLYKSGVLEGACGSNLDHGVLAVGYGTENGKDYWLVKNSWGATWGDKGFVKLLRGKGGAGECGLLKQASYPVVSGSSPSPPAPPSPPSPPSPPAPPSPPSPPSSTHYEKPPCRSDEVDVQVQGLTGSTCSPKCSGTTCPTDVPAGTTAKPQCVLQDSSSGDKYCALTCFLGGCPTGSKCRHSGLVGLCMYDDSGAKGRKTFEVTTENLITV